MSEWSGYGKIVARYTGTGDLQFGDMALDCRFDVVQFADGDLRAFCTTEGAIPFQKRLSAFTGLMDDGRPLVLSGDLHVTRIDSTGVTIVGTFLRVGKRPTETTAAEYRFGLTNLFLLRPGAQFCIGDRNALIRRVHDYESVSREMKKARGVDLTCDASIAAVPGVDPKEVTTNIDELCLLLTLASGHRVSWLYRLSATGTDPPDVFHVNAITSRYGGHPLVDIRLPDGLRRYVETVHPRLRLAEQLWQFRKALDAYTVPKTERTFLEARALQLVVVVEHLVSCWRHRAGSETVLVPRESFEASIKVLGKEVGRALNAVYPAADDAQLKLMVKNVRGLNNYPFAAAFREMCDELGLRTNSRERRRLIQIRNELVHRYSFPASLGPPPQQFYFLMTYVGKLLLAALSYSGTYHHWAVKDGRLTHDEVHLDLNRVD